MSTQAAFTEGLPHTHQRSLAKGNHVEKSELLATVLEEVILGILPKLPTQVGVSFPEAHGYMDDGKNLMKLKFCEEGIWLGRLTT